MRIFQRLRTKKAQDRGKEITEAVRAYNEALSALGEAAGTIGRVAKENGVSTEKIETSVAKMQEIARTAQICPEDLTRGGNNRGKGQRN